MYHYIIRGSGTEAHRQVFNRMQAWTEYTKHVDVIDWAYTETPKGLTAVYSMLTSESVKEFEDNVLDIFRLVLPDEIKMEFCRVNMITGDRFPADGRDMAEVLMPTAAR